MTDEHLKRDASNLMTACLMGVWASLAAVGAKYARLCTTPVRKGGKVMSPPELKVFGDPVADWKNR
jgi:hypothetical protein